MAYIYALADSRNPCDYRYIGKTTHHFEKRLREHLSAAVKQSAKNSHKNNWIKKVLAEYSDIVPVVLEICSDSEVDNRERFQIQRFRSLGFNLTNVADGGDGGRTITDANREAFSNKLRASFAGLRKSAEHKAAIGRSNSGKRRSPEQLVRISESQKGRHIGEKNMQAKLTETEVRQLREDAATLSYSKLSKKYDISKSQVARIVTGASWGISHAAP
jgi:hypothetical protein